MDSEYPDETASTFASWSWTVWVFISGIFFGTVVSGKRMLLYWKSSLEEKFWAWLLGFPLSTHLSPLGYQDSPSAYPMDSDIIQDSASGQKESSSTHSRDSRNINSRSPSWCHDVFLSFRETQPNHFSFYLYGHLKRIGVSAFKNDERRLDRGEHIPTQLRQAIKDSPISIVVFSKDYADSPWCLEEMATIAECMNKSEQTVFTIFNDVSPSHVCHQTGPYRSAFVSLAKRFEGDPDQVDRWKRAMREVANSDGWVLRDGRKLSEIRNIVQKVIDTLGREFSKSTDDQARMQLPTDSKVIKDSPLDQKETLSTQPPYSKVIKDNSFSKIIKDNSSGQEYTLPTQPLYSEFIKDSPLGQKETLSTHPLYSKVSRDSAEDALSTHPLYFKDHQNRPSSQRVYKYDVFLSFEGSDTCKDFTNPLYKCLVRRGISTFKNDERHKLGEHISLQILRAIQDSRISIVVFSRNYASSTSCLEEMAIIDDSQKILKQVVFPVFYDMDPSHVRHQTGAYEDAFVFHTKTAEEEPITIYRWKNAMRDLAELKGLVLTNKPKFSDIEGLIEVVMNKLGRKFTRSVDDDLVGIQSHVEYLEKLLKLSSANDDFRVLGICGMDGIGKTTHASVLYDRIFDQFDASCFVENISQIYKDGGAIAVQKQVLQQTSNEQIQEICSPFEISGFVRKKLSPKKVLIVLDNVDELEQLEKLAISPRLLGKGSRIIITTRDEHILRVYGADEIYKVPLLSYNDAHELLLRKAFNSENTRSSSCVELIPEILEHVQSLPLAIRVVGSFLYTQDDAQWKDALERLRKNPDEEIMDILRISFEELRPNEKEIFLHIACFFHGKREEYVKRILDSCGLYSHIGIQVIMEKSLITIKDREIHMHIMLQELGRKIVREANPEDPGLWSRLWLYKDFENVSRSTKGANNIIKAIVLDQGEDVFPSLWIGGLSIMKNLRLLIVKHQQFRGRSLDFLLSNNLRYLLWHGYPFSTLPLFNPYSRLVELNMPNSGIKRLWEGHKNFPYLERVDLSNSKDLMETPNFEGSPILKRLDLTGCTNLDHVHPSIGFLNKLVYLNLHNCCNLVSLDLGTECKLSSLRVLRFSGCKKLKETPDFTRFSNLKYLDLEQCTRLLTVHDSIWALTTLKFFSLRGCTNLVEIPDNLSNMTSLQTLDLSGCMPLGQRVMSSSNLKSSIFLRLGFRERRGIPHAMGELRCLERLNLERSYFSYVPDTIKKFSRLAYLNLMHYCELTRLPQLPFGLHQGEGISPQHPHLVILCQDYISSTATGL